MTLVLVMVAAAVGAPLRYVVDQAVQHRWPGAFPAGTLTVNLSGAFVLGLLTGLAAHHGLAPQEVTVLGTGLLGGYTTFSTYAVDVQQLVDAGRARTGLLYLAGTLVAALAAVYAGIAATRLLARTRRGRA